MKRRFLSALGLLTSAVLILSGCSSSSDGPEEADKEVVFVHALGANPAHLNPAITLDTGTSVGLTIYETLVDLSNSFEILPSLAKEWSVEEEGKVIRFTLQSGVKWHDGEDFTSDDVKFTLEEVMKMHPTAGVVASNILEVEAASDTEVIVRFNEPVAMFLEALTSLVILPEHIFAGEEIATHPANLEPIGTGPFVLEEYIQGDRIVVIQNENYWGDPGEIDRIVFKIVPDSSARVLSIEAGELDYVSATDLDQSQVERLQNTTDLQFISKASPPIGFVLFANIEDQTLSDVRIREALYRAIDREAIAERAWHGASPATSFLPEQVGWAHPLQADLMEMYPFDPDEATRMLDELGYTADASGNRLALTLHLGSGYSSWLQSAELIKNDLENIGVSIEIVASELSVFVETAYVNHDFQLAVMQFGTTPDPNLGIARQYVCNAESRPFANPTQMCDSEIDEAFSLASITTDRQARAEELATAGNRIANLLYTSPLVFATPPAALSDKWGNIEEFQSIFSMDHTKITLNR